MNIKLKKKQNIFVIKNVIQFIKSTITESYIENIKKNTNNLNFSFLSFEKNLLI